jgi:Tol biopolymer transport system component
MFRRHWSKKLSPALLIPLFWVGCKHAPKVGPLPENRDGSQQVIVEEGQNSQAVYSPRGDKLLFVSRGRVAHRQAQIYEKDLNTGVERRITFQNGNNMGPRYHPKENLIVYASSTDELKENPPLLNPVSGVSKLPAPYQEPMELYFHSLRALEITRVSDHFGFDGEARFSNDGKELTWTRALGQKTEVLSMNRSSHVTRTLKGLGVNPTQYVIAPDGKTQAWVDWDESFGVARLRVQKGKEKPVEVGAEMIVQKTDLNFSPDSKWLLWAQRDARTPVYDLWALDLATMCVRRLTTNGEGERRDPTVSPDMKWLTYTWVHKDRSRIARAGFAPAAGPCPTTP